MGKQLYRLPNIGANIITDVGQMKLAQPTGYGCSAQFVGRAEQREPRWMRLNISHAAQIPRFKPGVSAPYKTALITQALARRLSIFQPEMPANIWPYDFFHMKIKPQM